ncbi:MAG: PKD domain-containing protein [Candidatus Riflebacteria bacterium]
MAENRRNTNLLLLICALMGTIIFYGCGGGSSSDPLPTGSGSTFQITGKVTSNSGLASILAESDLRAATSMANIEVYLESNRQSYSTRTDEQGNFVLPVPQGTHNVVALIKTVSGNVYKARSQAITVSPAKPTVELTTNMILSQATSKISGIVRDSNGNPIPSAKITIWGEETIAGVDGTFMAYMPAGIQAEVMINGTGYQNTVVTVTFDDRNPLYIEQTLAPSASTNRAPVATLKATTYELSPRQQVVLTGSASDPDGDNLTYNWSATSGTVATQGSNLAAVFTAPDVQTTATITLKVTDKSGLTAAANIQIKIGSGSGGGTNYAPVVLSIDSDATTFLANTQHVLTANASDANGDALTYTWSATAGTLNPTNQVTTTWTTPNVTGTTYPQIRVLVSDGKGGTALKVATFTVSSDPNPPPNQTPVVTITAPINNSLSAPTTIFYSATATDAEEGNLTSSAFTWYQSKEGETAVMIGNQRSSLSLQVTEPATYVVTVQANDSIGATGQATVKFRINSNPFAQITSPADKSIFQLGASVSFTGIGTDVEDITIPAASLTWTLPGGATLTGSNFSRTDLPAGTQTVTLKSKDKIGAESSAASIEVFINTSPTISSIGPASGTVYLSGDPITFSANATDPNQSLSAGHYQWRRGLTTIAMGNPVIVSTLTAGIHDITLVVSDSQGGSVSSSTRVIVNQRPTMTINAPANNAVVTLNQQFTFTGSGISGLDSSSISSGTMKWEDNFNNATSTIKTGESSFAYTYTDAAKLGKHVITLTGSDIYGVSSFSQHVLFINATPTVTITAPASGTRYDTGATISFSSSGSDVDPTDVLTYTWFDGTTQIGTGQNYSTSSLASGNHNIFCNATDLYSSTSIASTAVFVNTLPTGSITISSTQYATAPNNVPVFLSTQPNLELTFTMNSNDFEIGGPIENFNPENIRWYTNIGGGYVFNGTGNTLVHSMPLGSATVMAELRDSFYGTFPATQTSVVVYKSLHVWQSRSFNYGVSPIPSARALFIEGSGVGQTPTLYTTHNTTTTPWVRSLEFQGTKFNADFNTDFTDYSAQASYTFQPVSGTVFDGKVTILGLNVASQAMVTFEEVGSWTRLFAANIGGVNQFNNATSIAFNNDVAALKLAYAANSNGQLLSFDSDTGNNANALTEANSIAFGTSLRVRFTDVLPDTLGKLFLADRNNNRVVMMNSGMANPTSLTAPNPIDIAFAKTHIFTLDGTTSEITLIDPSTNQQLMKFGTSGTGNGQFESPASIYSSGYDLFIAENSRIQVIRSGLADWLKN